VAVLLTVVVTFVGVRLVVRMRRGKFGSRLLIKLAGIFAVVGLLPGLVIYTVSYQFVSRSIEAWFDVKVAGALDSGLALARRRSTRWPPTSRTRHAWRPSGWRGPHGVAAGAGAAARADRASAASLLAASGQVLLSAGGGMAEGTPERPAAHLLRQARLSGSASAVERLDDESLAAAGAGRRCARWPACRAARSRWRRATNAW